MAIPYIGRPKAVSYNGYIFGSADSYSVYFCTFFFAL
jgi:hypothetical protein